MNLKRSAQINTPFQSQTTKTSKFDVQMSFHDEGAESDNSQNYKMVVHLKERCVVLMDWLTYFPRVWAWLLEYQAKK